MRQIVSHGARREIAVAGDSVTLELADELDLARGDLIADAARLPREARELELTLVWLGAESLRLGRYLVQQAARRVMGRIESVSARLEPGTLEERRVEGSVDTNDIVKARLALQAPLFVDPYDAVRATGALILIDEATNHTVAAAMVR